MAIKNTTYSAVDILIFLLPSIFHNSAVMKIFMDVFAKILIQYPISTPTSSKIFFSSTELGLVKLLDTLPNYFYPQFISNDSNNTEYLQNFLYWLANWMSLVLKGDWTPERKSEIISKIIPIYRKRGTSQGLRELLSIYLETPLEKVEIRDQAGTLNTLGEAEIGKIELGREAIIDEFFLYSQSELNLGHVPIEYETQIKQCIKNETNKYLIPILELINQEMAAHAICSYRYKINFQNTDGTQIASIDGEANIQKNKISLEPKDEDITLL